MIYYSISYRVRIFRDEYVEVEVSEVNRKAWHFLLKKDILNFIIIDFLCKIL